METAPVIKETTVHSLIIARSLFDECETLCLSENRYLASAGLVILQDAMEIVFLALLIQKGVDETKNLESKDFDELLGELKKVTTVAKSGSLKALNKQRVLTKHFAQVAEPITVRNYYHAAKEAIEKAVKGVTGKSISQIYLSDILDAGEVQTLLKNAEKNLDEGRIVDALVEIRKAIFIEFEFDYSVYDWRNHEKAARRPWDQAFAILGGRGGSKAPYYATSKQWIKKNVRTPFDYVQIDLEQWKLDAMEWGISTVELSNLTHMTPAVFRETRDSEWKVKRTPEFYERNPDAKDVQYCLDKAVHAIVKKHQHRKRVRNLPGRGGVASNLLSEEYEGNNIYERASASSAVIGSVLSRSRFAYYVRARLDGFDNSECFYEVVGYSDAEDPKNPGQPEKMVQGFILIHPDHKV